MPTPNIVKRAEPTPYNPFSPDCRKCKEHHGLIHVITHECLEGDALRCVIKAVTDDTPLEPDDYVRAGDILKLFNELQPKPEPTPSKTSSKKPSKPTNTTRPVSSSATLPATVGKTTTGGLPASSSSVASASSGAVVTSRLSSSTVIVTSSSGSHTVITVSRTTSSGTTSSSKYVSLTSATLPASSPLSTSTSRTTSSVSSSLNILTTITQASISCTTLTTAVISTITPSTSTAPSSSSTSSVIIRHPNSNTIKAPSGGWPFQRTSTLTSSGRPTTAPGLQREANGRVIRPVAPPSQAAPQPNGRIPDKPVSQFPDNFRTNARPHVQREQTSAFSLAELFSNDHAISKATILQVIEDPKDAASPDPTLPKVHLTTSESLNPNALHNLSPRAAAPLAGAEPAPRPQYVPPPGYTDPLPTHTKSELDSNLIPTLLPPQHLTNYTPPAYYPWEPEKQLQKPVAVVALVAVGIVFLISMVGVGAWVLRRRERKAEETKKMESGGW